MGSDPLDWIGEPAPRKRDGGESGPPGQDLEKDSGQPPERAMLPIPSPAAFAMERQLLLVDGVVREGFRRPRLNRRVH